jgi:hypothetical protein
MLARLLRRTTAEPMIGCDIVVTAAGTDAGAAALQIGAASS